MLKRNIDRQTDRQTRRDGQTRRMDRQDGRRDRVIPIYPKMIMIALFSKRSNLNFTPVDHSC